MKYPYNIELNLNFQIHIIVKQAQLIVFPDSWAMEGELKQKAFVISIQTVW